MVQIPPINMTAACIEYNRSKLLNEGIGFWFLIDYKPTFKK